jgi:3-deoxy-manno-octulosonate cytidylyltransferase (CMP-KDO synthetase)
LRLKARENMQKTLILIPARMAATRLPNKPLADIHELPMIVHVYNRAKEANLGEVLVACDNVTIQRVIESQGGKAILTREDHPSGSDRIYEALQKFDPEGVYQHIINVQGDLPTLDPSLIQEAASLLAGEADITTLGVKITREEEKTNPNVVKIIATPLTPTHLRALYFTRATAPWGEGELYHHIGLYGYKRAALAKFVSLAPSPLEKREKLEQLRALENGMRIDVGLVETVPLGVDTIEDLARAREMMKREMMKRELLK